MTLSELQEIAMRQQQQIEHNQQLLVAKEKRLKYLRQEELKRQQQYPIQQQQNDEQNRSRPHHQNHQQATSQLNNKENMINNQFSQELKLLKLKQLRNQLMEQKTSNSNMYSEVDLIKNLFADKERELYDAISKVSELTKQIDQLRKIKASNQHQQQQQQFTTSNANELEKLKQELLIRNKLNEQQAKKIMQQHDLFQQKQQEVLALDKRIEELQGRIANKRILNQQIQNQFSTATTQISQLTIEPSPIQQQQQYNSPSNNLFDDDPRQRQQNKIISTNSPTSFTDSISPSPSKTIPKFATKQEIANTYMNKFGSEAYQKYQETSKRLLQKQQQIIQEEVFKFNQQQTNIIKQQTSIDSNDSSSNTSNSVSPSANQNSAASDTQQQQQTEQSSLPSHLRLEFDKIKFIPDMVKTIKKRHSISDIEGSVHTVPPQVFQKMLEQHHKNSQLNKPAAVQPQPQADSSKLKSIKENENENNNNSSVKMNEDGTKKTKSIIKKIVNVKMNLTRRVNFDPHALLLDAAVEGEVELVVKCSTLVKSISEPNDEGITALHNSVCAGHFDIVKYLVEFGCDVNYADNDGWTSLHCAASCNNLQMVKFLIEHGASLFATTISDNETAVDKCEEDEDGFAGCSEYLLQMEDKLGGINFGLVYGLYDYEAENDDELTFKCSDQMKILAKSNEYNDEGWWLAELKDRKGLVPRNFIGLFPRVKPAKYESTVC